MPVDAGLGLPLLFGFLLVLVRVAGVCALVPVPGLQASPVMARVVLAVTITLVLYPEWPAPETVPANGGALLLAVISESGIGLALGLAVSFILEAFVTAAQILSLNAGYSFASTIDPSTQAESGVLVIFAQLAGSMIFLALGLDREVIRVLAYSLEAHAAGAWFPLRAAGDVIHLGAEMLAMAVRLALPVVALLVLVDVSLGLATRLNAQLQLLSLAFPIKMMAALVLLGWVTVLVPKLLSAYSMNIFGTIRRTLRL